MLLLRGDCKLSIKRFLTEYGTRLLFVFVIVFTYTMLIRYTYEQGGIGHGGNLFEPTHDDGITVMDYDTGMDFFSSIQYTKGRNPYMEYETLYPPLANLMFYCMYKLLPADVQELIPGTFDDIIFARTTYNDMRVHQSAAFLFIIYNITIMILLFVMFQKILNNSELAAVTSFAACYSIVVVRALERGNIILIALLLTLFFLKYNDNENRLLRELSFIALALAAGLKLYPAMFGIILVSQKRFVEAIRTMGYGVIATFLPFRAFGGFEAFEVFIKVFKEFSAGDISYFNSYGIKSIVKLILYMIECLKNNASFGTNLSLENYSSVLLIASICAYIIAVLFIVFSFFEKAYWKKVLFIGLTIVSIQDSAVYSGVFLLISLLFMMAEEPSLNMNNVIEYCLLVFMMVPVPYNGNPIAYPGMSPYTFVMTFYQIVYCLLMLRMAWVGIKNFKVSLNSKKLDAMA